MRGVDISHYQKGLTIRQVKDGGNDFAILKITEGNFLIDNAAFDFYREAYELGFPVGGYCYSHASTPEQAGREAAFLLKTINGFPMPCGLFLDVEEPKQLGLPHDALKAVADAWCAAIRAAGYTPGIYSSEGTLWAKLKPDELPDGTLVWVAHYGRQPDIPCDLWQSSDCGSVPGYDGAVDTDETRSERFMTIVRRGFGAEKEAPAKVEPSPEIMILQLLLHYRGRWDKPDGLPSPAFFREARDYIDRLEGGINE